ncbi:MAG TPA: phosphoribosylamine--glycine ligase [Candidatus Polarisedimenticolaceae bacterium]
MKVLLVGGGGREDALAWALARSPEIRTLRCAPGNAGIARYAERVPIAAEDVASLVAHAVAERYDLVVVGPEVPLVLGLADRLGDAGLAVFGPSAASARLEGSKVYAKEFMARHAIPTAGFRVFDDAGECTRYLLSDEAAYPLVVKADGLAAGKGVVIAPDPETALESAEGMLSGRDFGDAGRRVVIEELLRGREASFFCLCDGVRFLELAPCQDYKRAGDADTGPNTGGMGTYSPSAHLGDDSRAFLRDRVVAPLLAGMAAEGHPYRGVLFVGVMLTPDGPRVLEFNARFGDPETQVLIPRLDGDWLPLLRAAAAGDLRGVEARFRRDAAVCVVMTAEGYPGKYAKGTPISGLDAAEAIEGVVVFHAGTEHDAAGRVVTSGGRVLGVTAIGADVARARARAYDAVACIRWEGERHRADIAADAV